MTEFQAAVLLAQLQRFPGQQARRTAAAAYLTERLREIPGVVPLEVPSGVTAHSWYTYHWRWLGARQGGLDKFAFAEALRAEGVPVLHGYVPINRNEAVRTEIKRLGGAEPAACPAAEKADAEEILAFSSPILMAPDADLDDVIRAVEKVARYRA
jgi:dTDP-4-amino-4,6-dideoxygalactose transaminase